MRIDDAGKYLAPAVSRPFEEARGNTLVLFL